MALYDNKYWLLSHIRNSYISTDDTGMCELVMVGEDLPKKLIYALDSYTDPDESSEDEDEVEHESYDLQFDSQFSRLRSDMAVRMEKMAQAKKRAAKIKQVKWENNASELNESDATDLFCKKKVDKHKPCSRSILSERLENSTMIPRNPFTDYAKFDGSSQIGIPTRKFKIFLTMLPEEQKNYPMIVCCIAAAKIQEFIGLILLKCSTVHGDIPLESVNHYGLYLTEDDGEVDRDFPCLDPRECVAKFAFTYLSLVEHRSGRLSFDSTYEGDPDTTDDVPIADVTDSPLQEARDSVGMVLMEVHNTAMESQLYKSFQVSIISKVKPKIDIHLGISGEKIEIDPVQQRNSKFPFVRQKAVSHHMDSVASCEITEAKGSRSMFKLVYTAPVANTNSFSETSISGSILQSSVGFKHYNLEADTNTVKEIVQKVNQLLEIRSSSSRKEYLGIKERKLQKKKSFNMNK